MSAWKAATGALFFGIGMRGGSTAAVMGLGLFVTSTQYKDPDNLKYWGLAGLIAGMVAGGNSFGSLFSSFVA